jgi:hypothetical protein
MRQAAKFAPIAALIREQMRTLSLTRETLASQFPNPQAFKSNLSIWLAAKGTPGPRYRGKLAEVLGIAPEQLLANGAAKPSKALALLPQAKPTAKPNASVAADAGEINIAVSRNGTIVIRLKLTKEPM